MTSNQGLNRVYLSFVVCLVQNELISVLGVIQCRRILDYWPNLALRKMPLKLEYLSKFFVLTVWIPVFVHAKGLVWMTNISC